MFRKCTELMSVYKTYPQTLAEDKENSFFPKGFHSVCDSSM